MIGLVLKNIYDKLSTKIDQPLCERTHDVIAERFSSGMRRFEAGEKRADELMKELKDQKEILIRVDERVHTLLKKNGVNL